MANRFLVDEIPDRPWAGQRCWIIGGGESLKGFDFSVLRGENVIAINRAVEVAPFAEVMFSMDSRLYGWYKRRHPEMPTESHDAFAACRGLRVWVAGDGDTFENDVLLVKRLGNRGFSMSLRDGIYTGGNSGYAALQLAACLGATTIYLLGYDMTQGNFHSGYPTSGSDPKTRGWIEGFNKLAPKLAAAGIQVVNMNPASRLRCFPFGEIKQKRRVGSWKVVSFYTSGTGYEKEIEGLVDSLRQLGLDYKLYAYPPQGSWRMNLNYKSKCILRALREFPKTDIVFIDADGIVHKHPVLFDELTASGAYDIAASFHQYMNRKSGDSDELLSGTLWIKNSKGGREIIQRWHEIGVKNLNVRHQKCLRLALEEMDRMEKCYRMPFEYTYIFDYHYKEKREPVIEHFQASRRLRSAVGFGVDMIKGQTK